MSKLWPKKKKKWALENFDSISRKTLTFPLYKNSSKLILTQKNFETLPKTTPKLIYNHLKHFYSNLGFSSNPNTTLKGVRVSFIPLISFFSLPSSLFGSNPWRAQNQLGLLSHSLNHALVLNVKICPNEKCYSNTNFWS